MKAVFLFLIAVLLGGCGQPPKTNYKIVKGFSGINVLKISGHHNGLSEFLVRVELQNVSTNTLPPLKATVNLTDPAGQELMIDFDSEQFVIAPGKSQTINIPIGIAPTEEPSIVQIFINKADEKE